jgi:hypothetical protein
MTTFTGSDGTVHHIGEGEDSWCAQELDGLQDDLDTARMDKAEAIRKMGVARERAKNNSRKFARLKKNFNDKLLLGHMELRDKAMIYLDLIDEYESLLKYTAPGAISSGTIKKLRQRGGLIV